MRFSRYLLALLFASAGVGLAAAERPLAVDKARSRVEIVVKATVDSFTGRLADFQPAIMVDPESGRVVAAQFGFHFADVKTGKPNRDEQMHAWQDTAQHPDGHFRLAALTPGPDGRFNATGVLTFHGVTREIAFPATVTTDRRLYAVDGEAAIDTREFDLPVIRKFGLLKVDPLVRVRFHLQGVIGEGVLPP